MLFKNHFKEQFDNRIKECTGCDLQGCGKPILGYGSLNANVMFIGDVAKEGDLSAMVPFTGISKTRMTEVIKATELKKEEYYLTYLIKHILPDKKIPSNTQAKQCLKNLLDEIELINPKIICTMGYYVTKYLMEAYDMGDQKKSLTELHGNGYVIRAKASYKTKYKKRIADRPKRYLIPTWSPAVDNPIMNKQMMEDISTIQTVRKLGILLWL